MLKSHERQKTSDVKHASRRQIPLPSQLSGIRGARYDDYACSHSLGGRMLVGDLLKAHARGVSGRGGVARTCCGKPFVYSLG